MTKDLDKVARVVRHFDASPERVFDAWLEPRVASKWLFTSPTSETHSTLIDARVGGAWAITDRRQGTNYTAVGTYLEIDRPRRLVFEFGMPQFSPEFSRVIVEVAPEGEGCILTLTQKPVPPAAAGATTEGWRQMLEALAASLANVRGEGDRHREAKIIARPGTPQPNRPGGPPRKQAHAAMVSADSPQTRT